MHGAEVELRLAQPLDGSLLSSNFGLDLDRSRSNTHSQPLRNGLQSIQLDLGIQHTGVLSFILNIALTHYHIQAIPK